MRQNTVALIQAARSRALFACVAAACLYAAPSSAWADVDGPGMGQDSFNVSGSIPEGSSANVFLQLSINGETNASGTLGTTTHRFNANTLNLNAPGSTGAGTSVGAGGGGTTQSFNTNLTYNQNGSYNVSFGQNFSANTRENPGPASGSNNLNWNSFQANNRNINVTNVAPTITSATQNGSNGNIAVNEGSTVGLQMSATDPGADSQVFEINGASQPLGVGGNTPGSTRTSNSVNVTYNNQGTFFNTYQATDQDGAASLNGALTRQVTVNNVLPQSATLGLFSLTIDEGQTVGVNMSATDPGADALTFFANGNNIGVGGSTPGSLRTASGTLGPFYEHNGGSQTYNIGGQVFDDVGASSSNSQLLTVLNVAPSLLSVTGDLTVVNGDPVNFAATGSDPGLDTLTFAWDWDNDGQYDDYVGDSGQIPASFYAGNPLNQSYLVGVKLSDGDGGMSFGSFQYTLVPEPATIVLGAWFAVVAVWIGRRRRARA